MALSALLAIYMIFQSGESYVIRLKDQEQTVMDIPLGDEDYFDIAFKHSVNKGLVIERYQIDKEHMTIYLRSGWFENYGAGMMDTVEDGMAMTEEGDMLKIDFPRSDMESVTYRSGGIAGHKFTYGSQEIDLFDHWPYKSVTISLEKNSIFNKLF